VLYYLISVLFYFYTISLYVYILFLRVIPPTDRPASIFTPADDSLTAISIYIGFASYIIW
jgi:hypothetical protein